MTFVAIGSLRVNCAGGGGGGGGGGGESVHFYL